jgi:hypothetical protein
MKTFAFWFFLFCTSVFAQSKPENYSIVVHVSASRIGVESWGTNTESVQKLNVTIDGKKYELQHTQLRGASLLRVGEYKARLIDNSLGNSYELNQVYEFIFADGKTRKFQVVGMEE